MTESITSSALSAALLTEWLIQRVAYYVECPLTDIDTGVLLASYGLDSVYAFALCGDIEDELGLPVEPTAVWDFGTISALASHLADLAPVSPAGQDKGQSAPAGQVGP